MSFDVEFWLSVDIRKTSHEKGVHSGQIVNRQLATRNDDTQTFDHLKIRSCLRFVGPHHRKPAKASLVSREAFIELHFGATRQFQPMNANNSPRSVPKTNLLLTQLSGLGL